MVYFAQLEKIAQGTVLKKHITEEIIQLVEVYFQEEKDQILFMDILQD
jgi:hypothetical protein